jgi:hypothetical protein
MKMISLTCKCFSSFYYFQLLGLFAFVSQLSRSNLSCSDDDFIEPPPKRVRSDAVSPTAAASEASAPKTTPTAQASTASSLSKGKDAPAAAAAPPSVSLH